MTGADCILQCQIRENDKLTVWCQQHDHVDFHPQKARTYELASICNDESADIVLFLMSIDRPTQEVTRSIQGAVEWFNASTIFGLRVKTISAPNTKFIYRTSNEDKIVVEDSKALPIWARFYELGTHKPLFCNRDGKPVYSLAEVERERRVGYRWYTYEPQKVLDAYSAWIKKHRTEQ